MQTCKHERLSKRICESWEDEYLWITALVKHSKVFKVQMRRKCKDCGEYIWGEVSDEDARNIQLKYKEGDSDVSE